MKNTHTPNLQDVHFHLANLKTDFARIIIDYNKNPSIVFAMESLTAKASLVEQIVKTYDNKNFKSLSNEINSILLTDNELHGINVQIYKQAKGCKIDFAKFAKISFPI
jgi:hypothetical protein